MIKEEWRLIPDEVSKYGHTYSVSNLGNVKNNKTGKLLSKRQEVKGYYRAKLPSGEHKLHRLVAFAFIVNDDTLNKNQVNHIDGVKTNNRVDNLEWCTNSENQQHAYDNKLKEVMNGELNGRAILTEEQVMDIWFNFYDEQYIVDVYGLTYDSARNLLNRKSWKYLIPIFDEKYGEDYYKEKLRNKPSRVTGNHCRKLTDEQCFNIYTRANNDEPLASLAREYNANDATIYGIKHAKPKYMQKILKEKGVI